MPELPEVEGFRKKIDPTALHKKIQNIEIHDAYILKIPENKFKKTLQGKEFNLTKRRGKYLFVGFNSKNMMLHFAMSGNVKYFNDLSQEPEYSKIRIKFENGDYLSIISIRKLGRVEIINEIEEFIKENEIGPDALELNLKEFKKIMREKRRSYAKTALMDQSALSGIGNEYSDEILFQAKIYPKIKISDLEESSIEILYKSIKKVLKTAIDININDKEFPNEFIITHRDEKDNCPKCGSNIKKFKISSRHGFYCPSCQKT
jgi:formamidopyrimidine-DNA glycosylase